MADETELPQVCKEQMYREMVYIVYNVQYKEENALTGIKFLYYGSFLTGSVTEKSFWQVWLPVRFSGVWGGGNLRI
jgi:hypothetical protein